MEPHLIIRGLKPYQARRTTMQAAVWVECPGIKNDGRAAHMLRDYCSTCAPWWEKLPTCPHCGGRLLKSGKTKCKGCSRFVVVGKKP
jgi:hypothetical protein